MLEGENKEKIARLYNEGYTHMEIALETGYHESYFTKLLRILDKEGKLDKELHIENRRKRKAKKKEQNQKKEIEPKKIDICPSEQMEKCYYGSQCGTCDYILIEGHSRPCKGGKKCECFRTYDGKSGGQKYTENVQHWNSRRNAFKCD